MPCWLESCTCSSPSPRLSGVLSLAENNLEYGGRKSAGASVWSPRQSPTRQQQSRHTCARERAHSQTITSSRSVLSRSNLVHALRPLLTGATMFEIHSRGTITRMPDALCSTQFAAVQRRSGAAGLAACDLQRSCSAKAAPRSSFSPSWRSNAQRRLQGPIHVGPQAWEQADVCAGPPSRPVATGAGVSASSPSALPELSSKSCAVAALLPKWLGHWLPCAAPAHRCTRPPIACQILLPLNGGKSTPAGTRGTPNFSGPVVLADITPAVILPRHSPLPRCATGG